MDAAEIISGDPSFEGYDVLQGNVPAYDADTVAGCRRLCEQNVCGSYGTTWGCPPGYCTHMDALGREFSHAVILRKRYSEDPHDREAMKRIGSEMQDSVRRAVILLRTSGIRAKGFSDGGCDYCGVCTYPDPCRYPEMLIPSISALGIDLGDYLSGIGETLVFRDDSVTLYGLILVP